MSKEDEFKRREVISEPNLSSNSVRMLERIEKRKVFQSEGSDDSVASCSNLKVPHDEGVRFSRG